jgi:hypothetical protein
MKGALIFSEAGSSSTWLSPKMVSRAPRQRLLLATAIPPARHGLAAVPACRPGKDFA